MTDADAAREAAIRRIMADLAPTIEQAIRAALCSAEARASAVHREAPKGWQWKLVPADAYTHSLWMKGKIPHPLGERRGL